MKKIKLSREASYVLGITIMPFAVAFTVKADLGMSMIASPTYIISEKVSFLSYGMTEYIVQALIFAIMCIVIRKIKPAYFVTVISGIIYGTILDFAMWATNPITADNMVIRVFLFILGMTLTSLSVAFMFHTYIPPCAYDYFVAKIVAQKKLDSRKFKLSFDFSMLIIATALSLIFFHKLVGVNAGTLIMALLNGNLISLFSKLMDKHIEFFDRFSVSEYFD
ncbi:MAG: YitT family protein [Eubacterium sp.]